MKSMTTPLVQPKPVCTSYSPPPPAFPVSLTLYFSNMLQTSAPSGQENIVPLVYLLAMVSAILRASAFSVFKRPATRICCSGGQALGKSHCCPDSSRDVGTPP